jgi:hypothetical protein
MRSTPRLRALGRAAARLSAVWLMALTALPFTAPFATVDLADVCGAAHLRGAMMMVSAAGVGNAQPDDSADDVTTTVDSCRSLLRTTTRGVRTLVISPVALSATASAVLGTTAGSSPSPLRDGSILLVTLRL